MYIEQLSEGHSLSYLLIPEVDHRIYCQRMHDD